MRNVLYSPTTERKSRVLPLQYVGWCHLHAVSSQRCGGPAGANTDWYHPERHRSGMEANPWAWGGAAGWSCAGASAMVRLAVHPAHLAGSLQAGDVLGRLAAALRRSQPPRLAAHPADLAGL